MFTRAWEADIVMESFQFTPDAGGGIQPTSSGDSEPNNDHYTSRFPPEFKQITPLDTDTGVPGEAASAWRGCGKLKMAHQSVPSSWKATGYSRPVWTSSVM